MDEPRTGDLRTRADVNALLRAFYAVVMTDGLLGHVFVEVAHLDLEAHLPVIGDFWEKVLLGTGRYSGDAMRVHRALHAREPLTPAHFERWLDVWNHTVDARHHGPVATLAKRQAARIALAMQDRLYRDAASSTGDVIAPAGGRGPAATRSSPPDPRASTQQLYQLPQVPFSPRHHGLRSLP